VYGAAPHITDALTALAKETKARGWWHSYGDAVPDWFQPYVGMESAASRIRQYQCEVVPGLLQTKAYATAVNDLHHPEASESERERWLVVRMERQRLLTRRLPEPPRLEVILSEHALRQPIPDREAMIGQLNHLVDVGEWPHVSIRVLPFSAGMHRAAVVGRFVVFDFPADGRREPEPSIVYCESLTGALYLDKEHEAETFKAVWKSIDRLALDEAESMVMIRAAAEEYTHDQLRADRVAQEHPQRRGR